MKKNDMILLGVIAIIAIVALAFFQRGGEKGANITVTVDQKLYGTYDLSKDQIIQINDTNVVKIENGQAKMIEADCPDGLCLRQHEISKDYESIVCLPNKVVVQAIGEESKKLDTSINP
ncbi:MAG TPA: NusG domain II-containing protein [Candidatus Merdenecus merdavium]|nr:NusG domain II-containing protein [Candidatus Merdenecus merdavium]